MAVTHPTSMRNLIADTVLGQIDGGSTFGQLTFLDSGSTILCLNAMASTAFGAASTGLATANTIQDGTVLLSATATLCLIRTSTQQNTALSGSVTSTGGGGDIELSSNVLSSGQTLSMTSLTYLAPS